MPAFRSHLSSLVTDFDRLGEETAITAFHGLRERSTSYRDLASLSRRFASELSRRGVHQGDRVLIWGENSAEWVGSFFGCVLAGVLAVPIDAASPVGFASRIIEEVTPKLVVGDTEKLRLLNADVPRLALQELLDLPAANNYKPTLGLKESDPLQIVFTSGTTGEPKGVVHTHHNVLASLRPIEEEIGKYLRYERPFHPIRILHTLPLSHVFGQFMGLWIPPLLGTEVHYQNRLVAPDLIEQIRTRRISVLAAVPRVLDLLRVYLLQRIPSLAKRLETAERIGAWRRWWRFRDVHRLFGFKFWAFVCGGASLTPDSERFWNSLGFVVIQGYGMTETTALVSLNHPFKLARGSVGQVLPGREVRLSDEGEVLVRGETISSTIWQGGQLHQAESDWLATGDLAEFDESGNLRFRGRKKDVIVTSAGLNIYPEDLEAALLRQPGVKACTVIEVPADHGPEPLAALVMADSSGPSEAVTAANRELADFQQIRRWVVWPEPDLPRTSTGKILRREVARMVHNGEVARSDAHSGELNLDSLGRVQLQAQLEQQFGISIDERALQEVKTNEDLRQLMARTPAAPALKGEADHVYPRWPWNPLMQKMRSAFLEAVAMPLLRFMTRTRVRRELTQWPDSPMLIVANHVTSYDVPFLLYALPGHLRRRVAVAMSGEMILDWRRSRNQGHWFLNLVAPIEYYLVTALFNIFPLPQMSGFRRSFRHAGEAVDRGYSVIVFPEGRRSDDGTPQPFKSGAGLLWKELGIPALPMRLHGLGEIKVQRGRWFRTGQISVSVGEVIPLPLDQSPEELTELLRKGVFGQ
ncbi:MAG: AMP-binding protein [Bryobacteraceae bacterium]